MDFDELDEVAEETDFAAEGQVDGQAFADALDVEEDQAHDGLLVDEVVAHDRLEHKGVPLGVRVRAVQLDVPHHQGFHARVVYCVLGVLVHVDEELDDLLVGVQPVVVQVLDHLLGRHALPFDAVEDQQDLVDDVHVLALVVVAHHLLEVGGHQLHDGLRAVLLQVELPFFLHEQQGLPQNEHRWVRSCGTFRSELFGPTDDGGDAFVDEFALGVVADGLPRVLALHLVLDAGDDGLQDEPVDVEGLLGGCHVVEDAIDFDIGLVAEGVGVGGSWAHSGVEGR